MRGEALAVRGREVHIGLEGAFQRLFEGTAKRGNLGEILVHLIDNERRACAEELIQPPHIDPPLAVAEFLTLDAALGVDRKNASEVNSLPA